MFDVIVVGGGVIGLSTSLHLVKSAQRTLLLEQFSCPHSCGSSTGQSRGFWYSHGKQIYAELMPAALQKWKELEDELSMSLILKCGLIRLSNHDHHKNLMKTIQSAGSEVKEVKPRTVDKKFVGLHSAGFHGLYDHDAGILRAAKCLEALQRAFLQRGGSLMEQEKVVEVRPIHSERVEVYTTKSCYVARAVVVACGPWTNFLLKPLALQVPLSVKRMRVGYFRTGNSNVYDAEGEFPLVVLRRGDDQVYSSPVFEYPNMMKVGTCDGVDVNADERDRPLTAIQRQKEGNEMKKLSEALTLHFPQLSSEPSIVETCVWSTTADHDWVIDRHPDYCNIIIGAGFSANCGFALAPSIGQLLGDLISLDQFPLDQFSLLRFNLTDAL